MIVSKSASSTDRSDAQYVAAYQHVHDVLTAAGATNVIWVWSPAVTAAGTSLATLYPGSSYVDWVGPDLYFDHPTDTLAALWDPVLADINTFAADKPLVFAETGMTPGATRPAQIADLVGGVMHTPRLTGIVWLKQTGRQNWRVSDDPMARAASVGNCPRRGSAHRGRAARLRYPRCTKTCPPSAAHHASVFRRLRLSEPGARPVGRAIP